MADATENPEDQAGKDKRKAKVRNVWISFAGRIVAQIVGAVASVVLGIMVLQRYTARAFGLFEQLRKDGNLPPNLAFDPLYEPLRRDARFAAYAPPAGR